MSRVQPWLIVLAIAVALAVELAQRTVAVLD